MTFNQFAILLLLLGLYGCMKGGDVNEVPPSSSSSVHSPSWPLGPSSYRFPHVG